MKNIKRFLTIFLLMCLLLTISGVTIKADDDFTPIIDFTVVDECLTAGLHSGDTLMLPIPRATIGKDDVSKDIKISIKDPKGTEYNPDNKLIIENMEEGNYVIQYYLYDEPCGKKKYLVVNDSYPTVDIEIPTSNIYVGQNLRVKKVIIPENTDYVVGVSLINGKGIKEGDAPDISLVTTRQIIFTPQRGGYSTLLYTLTSGTKVVKYAYTFEAIVDDYLGDFLGITFEDEDYPDPFPLGLYANCPDITDAILHFMTKEESRSGKQSYKFTVVDDRLEPTLYFGWDLSDKMMKKDDVTKYIVEFYIKIGDDFVSNGLPKFDCHLLARENWKLSSHYGVYEWTIGNILTEAIGKDDWTKVHFEFVSVSDDTVFEVDNIGTCSSADYISYGGIQMVFIASNFTGSIYFDDMSVYKEGVEIDDLLEICPHEVNDPTKPNNTTESDNPIEEQKSGKKGCKSSFSESLLSIGLLSTMLLSTVFLKRREEK